MFVKGNASSKYILPIVHALSRLHSSGAFWKYVYM
jgi:hypothetical protein